MVKRLVLGTALVVVIAGLGYRYAVLRAPSPEWVMPTPVAPALWTPSEPIQPKAMLPRPDPCYNIRVNDSPLDCHPPGRYEARPESPRMRQRVVDVVPAPNPPLIIETIKGGQRRVVLPPDAKLPNETIKKPKQ
jgi:hypothetical protein